MKFSRFFIDRPIFAAVLSIVITLCGGVAVFTLPLAQYPPIAPPTIFVQCNYAGASARDVAEAVAAPIEQQVNGVEGMMYMSSQCTNDGSYSLSVTFKPGIDLSFAQVLVQNRVNLALPQLPDVVKQAGVTTRKRSPEILLIVSINAPHGGIDQLYLSNFATIQLKDELLRVEGVGDVIMFGQQDYSMRIWVDPDKLYTRGMTTDDVVNAVAEQNQHIAAGQLGQPPVPRGQVFQYPITIKGRLSDPKDFDEMVVKTMPDGTVVRVRDIGRCTLGGKSLDITSRIDGKPCANIALFQLPDANALDTAQRIKKKMEELKQSFPPGLDYDIAYDTTPYVDESVREVFHTLRDSVILVAIVVLVFLQNWRSALIPLVAVPVAIIGTFAVMAAIGFSLNNLTLFGLVLAIGIVVDDAIVVVEAVEHHIEEGMTPRLATIKAMDEVSGPVIAVALVLSAVFVPCAFISGVTGQFFRQFALTIAVSTIISAFNSLTLSPALAAILLKPTTAKKDPFGRLLELCLGWFFRLFNFGLARGTAIYTRGVRLLLRGSFIVLLLYGGLLALTWWGFSRLPVGYIPNQDKGYLVVAIQLPDAASLERTQDITDTINRIALGDKVLNERAGWPMPGPGEKQHPGVPGVGHTITICGQSFVMSAYGSNFANFFVPLDGFEARRDPSLNSDVVAEEFRKRIKEEVPGAIVGVFGPPPVNGLGTAGGFKIIIEDRGDMGLTPLQEQVDNLIEKAKGIPELNGMFTVFRANAPQLFADIDREQCAMQNVRVGDVANTLEVYLGSLYVNDLNLFGRTWQVIVQADAPFRNRLDRVRRLQVRNRYGDMVPLGDLLRKGQPRDVSGPLILGRYNMYSAAAINGNIAPGVSTGQAIKVVEDLANKELPSRMAFEWTEITYLQLLSGNTAMTIFFLAVVFVFLVLAAQYESWSLPLAVILVVPMCLLGSITGVTIDKSDINIFTQIGFVVLVGLASKNAILIVEFAKHKYENGEPVEQAAVAACRLRLRPILMTSFAFILGVVPLITSRGAGAEMRHTLGTAVFSGMLGVTFFGIFLTPVFFLVVEKASHRGLFASLRMRRFNTYAFEAIQCGLFAAAAAAACRLAGASLAWTIACAVLAGLLGLVLTLLRLFQWSPHPMRTIAIRVTAPLARKISRVKLPNGIQARKSGRLPHIENDRKVVGNGDIQEGAGQSAKDAEEP